MNTTNLTKNDAIFRSAQDTEMGIDNFWSFVYYHGKLNCHFDDKDLSPGDLVACSVALQDYPLGKTLVEVDGIPSVCYLWQEEYPLHSDNTRYVRHGLIISVDDSVDQHKYAEQCMTEQRSGL